MSKVPYTVNVDEAVCTDLEYIRKMIETRDFSMLASTVERIQYHANNMESALWVYRDVKYALERKAKDKKITDKDFRKIAIAGLGKIASREEEDD